MEDIKISVITSEEYSAWDFIPPASHYFRNAVGNYIYIHTRCIKKAQEWIDNSEHFRSVPRKYHAIPSKQRAGAKNVNVRGTQTRRGQKKY